MATLTSQLRLTMFDGVTGPMRRISAQIAGFQARTRAAAAPMMGVTSRLLALGAGYVGVTAGVRGTIGAAVKFEEAFADVRKVLDGSPEQLSNVRQQIINLSKQLPTSAEGIASIYAAAAQSNIPIQELGKFSEMVAKVAVAWDTTEGDTSQALAEIKTQLNMNVEQIGLYADAINHLSNNTPARAAKLVEFSRRVAAQGEMFGFSAEQSLAFGSAMVSMGAEAEIAATSFRNMGKALTRGAGTKKEAMRGWRRIGMDPKVVAKDMQKDAKATTLKVIEAVQKVAKHERADIAFALFGEEARALMPVINDSRELRRELDMLGDKANYAGSAFKEYMERASTTSNALSILRNKIAAVGREWGDSWLEPIKRAGLGIGDVLDTLGERVSIFDKLGTAIKGFANGLGFNSGIRQVMNDLGDILLGKADGSSAADTLGRIFKTFQDLGKSVADFGSAYKDNSLVAFLGQLSGYGFQLFLAATGITLLAGAIGKLARMMMLLSGASAAIAILKTLAGIGGAIFGAAGGDAKDGKGKGTQKESTTGRKPTGAAGLPSTATTAKSAGILGLFGTVATAAAVVGVITAAIAEFGPDVVKKARKNAKGTPGWWLGIDATEDRYERLDRLNEERTRSRGGPLTRGRDSGTVDRERSLDNYLGGQDRAAPSEKQSKPADSFWSQMKSIWASVPSGLTKPAAPAPAPNQTTPFSFGQMFKDLMAPIGREPATDLSIRTLPPISGSVIAQPSGVQSVLVTNPQRPNITNNVTVYATTNASAEEIGSAVGARVSSAIDGYYGDGA